MECPTAPGEEHTLAGSTPQGGSNGLLNLDALFAEGGWAAFIGGPSTWQEAAEGGQSPAEQ